MKKILVVFSLLLIIAACQQLTNQSSKTAVEKIKQQTSTHITAFRNFVKDTLLVQIQQKKPLAEMQKSFLRARLLFKRTEWATEYFMGTTTRFVNGPPLPEIETEENKLTEPEGLQVMEAMLYPVPDSINYTELQRQAGLILSHATYYERYWNDLAIDSAQVLDAARLEVFRIITLGISGFDVPVALSSLPEAKESLQSVQEVMEIFDADKPMMELFSNAQQYLTANNDFIKFNRLVFIRDHCNPITTAIVALHKKLALPFTNDNRLLRTNASTLFDKDAFDTDAYIQDSGYKFTAAKVALGKKLFYDVVLSQSNTRSCASCHQPGKAFTDGLTTSMSVLNTAISRNAPTLLNAALQPSQFYDLRTTNLENQSRDVIHNKDEMHGNLSEALKKIVQDKNYDSLLRAAFPSTEIKEQQIQNALACYVRSLALLNSPFDEYMRGEKGASMSQQEINGFNLFMGKAKCGSCHFMPLFNGTVPPSFLEIESEVLGVPGEKNGKMIDKDPGRYAIYKLEPYRNAFKTTTVRNAALTAPYMHNGVFTTLEEVIDFYEKGGGVGMGLSISNQTLAPDSLHLTQSEKNDLIAFIKTLNDKVPQ